MLKSLPRWILAWHSDVIPFVVTCSMTNMFIVTAMWVICVASTALCFRTQGSHTLNTDDAPLNIQGDSIELASLVSKVPREARHTVRGLRTNASNSFNFKVPKLRFSVTIFPWEPEVPLDIDEVVDCLEAMHATLSRRADTESIGRKVIEESSSVQLTLEPLLLQEWNGRNRRLLQYGEAVRLFEALYDFLDKEDLYQLFSYQVYNVTDFVAVGWLKPLKMPPGQSLAFPMPVPPLAEATPIRTVIDRQLI